MKKTFKKGFTLIELTIVIAIIAILAGVMIPTYNVLMRNARQHLAYKQASAEYLHYRDKHVEYGTGEKLAKHVLINVNYEGDNYFFVAMDNAASVDDEPKLEDTLLFGSDDVNYIIGYSIEKDVSKRNNENQYYISGGDISADLPEQLDNVKMYELKLESDSTDDPDDPPDDPPVDPPTIIEGKKGDVIEFGSYPQSDVTDEMGNTLNKVINYSETMRPSEGEETYTTGNGYTWTSYKYYDNGVRANYAWYIDVECEGEKYRGMYFVKYRPCYSDRTAKNAKAEYPNSGWGGNIKMKTAILSILFTGSNMSLSNG